MGRRVRRGSRGKGKATPTADPRLAGRQELSVRLGVLRPSPERTTWGMLYLSRPGERRDPIPLWFLARLPSRFQGLRRRGERLPPDRRSLPGWAREVVFPELNVEESDLGSVLEARCRVPQGVRLELRSAGPAPPGGRPLHRRWRLALDRGERTWEAGVPPASLWVRVER
jgi:hypothetical protein